MLIKYARVYVTGKPFQDDVTLVLKAKPYYVPTILSMFDQPGKKLFGTSTQTNELKIDQLEKTCEGLTDKLCHWQKFQFTPEGSYFNPTHKYQTSQAKLYGTSTRVK